MGSRHFTYFFFGLMLFRPSSVALADPGVPVGEPIDETYRAEFVTCDSTDFFHGVKRLPPHACKTDPSQLTKLERIPSQGDRPKAILFVAKLADDRDGSKFACSTPGQTDKCTTSLMLAPTASTPCPKAAGTKPPCVPIDADRIAYIAIPAAGPASIMPREFRRKTGIGWGDYGVVRFNGKTIPVVVADGGTANKIGEGSRALLKLLSTDGRPHTAGAGVTYVIFPGSAEHLTVANVDEKVRTRGAELFRRLVAGSQ